MLAQQAGYGASSQSGPTDWQDPEWQTAKHWQGGASRGTGLQSFIHAAFTRRFRTSASLLFAAFFFHVAGLTWCSSLCVVRPSLVSQDHHQERERRATELSCVRACVRHPPVSADESSTQTSHAQRDYTSHDRARQPPPPRAVKNSARPPCQTPVNIRAALRPPVKHLSKSGPRSGPLSNPSKSRRCLAPLSKPSNSVKTRTPLGPLLSPSAGDGRSDAMRRAAPAARETSRLTSVRFRRLPSPLVLTGAESSVCPACVWRGDW